MTPSSLVPISRQLRRMVLQLSHRAKTAHVGSCLSCCDILVAALHGGLHLDPAKPDDPARDRLVFGKGHAAAALVSALAQRGYYPFEQLLQEFNQPGGIQEHPNLWCVPGVENASGSLGHALPMAVGMAWAARVRQLPSRICAISGDGEINEGSVWEAAMLAAAQKLGNLCHVVDFNRWQGTGRSCEILALEPLVDKWRSFGWQAVEADGHDPDALCGILARFGNSDRPLAVIAHTVKGKGISFMEDDNNWHYRLLSDDDMQRIAEELA